MALRGFAESDARARIQTRAHEPRAHADRPCLRVRSGAWQACLQLLTTLAFLLTRLLCPVSSRPLTFSLPLFALLLAALSP
eukprot:5484902-Pleurochrysis_carterae.AAC.1